MNKIKPAIQYIPSVMPDSAPASNVKMPAFRLPREWRLFASLTPVDKSRTGVRRPQERNSFDDTEMNHTVWNTSRTSSQKTCDDPVLRGGAELASGNFSPCDSMISTGMLLKLFVDGILKSPVSNGWELDIYEKYDLNLARVGGFHLQGIQG